MMPWIPWSWEEPLAAWLLTYLFHSTLLLGSVWLACRLRWLRSNELREALWKAALLGGLATSALQAWGGFESWTGSLAVRSAPAEMSSTVIHVRREWTPRNGSPGIHALAPAHQIRIESRDAKGGWVSWMVWLWLGLSAWGVARVIWLRLGLRRSLADRRAIADEGLIGCLERLRQQAGWRRPVLLSRSDAIAGPLALGGEICLPSRVLRELSSAQQESLLAHELAHIVRRDHWWLTVSALLERIFLFQPLNRLARRRIAEESEFLCDDWAVRHTGEGRRLAGCLAHVASWLRTRPREAMAPGMAARESAIVSRVRRLCGETPRPRRIGFAARAAAGAALLSAAILLAPAVTVEAPLASIMRELEATPFGNDTHHFLRLRLESLIPGEKDEGKPAKAPRKSYRI